MRQNNVNKKISVCKLEEKVICEKDLFKTDNWFLEIPKIELKAQISYGTTDEVMNQYIGHFDGTSTWDGNIGLAAHNRGYPVNYFAKLKDLNIDDEIIYVTSNGTRKYKVKTITIISDTDWSYLENTKDNRITLITCVEDKPNLRRCIQGIEI